MSKGVVMFVTTSHHKICRFSFVPVCERYYFQINNSTRTIICMPLPSSDVGYVK